MATLINNAGVQHYANKMVLAENRKVGSKSLPTALADIDNLIDEMKTQFDAEYGSALDMKLNNNENVFSVGTGTNIDKKSEVENSFTDVELSGNSLVNLFTTTQNFASFGKNIVRNGFVITLSNTSGWSKIGNRLNLKPNTTYYAQITCENKSNNTCSSYIRFSHNINYSTGINMPQFPANSTTTRNIVFTTDDTGLVLLSVERGEGTNESIFYDIILLEGDWTNKPIPQYFEGMKSVGQDDVNGHKIEISSQNKNLLTSDKFEKWGNEINIEYSGDIEKYVECSKTPFEVKPNTTYTFSALMRATSNLKGAEMYVYEYRKGETRFFKATPKHFSTNSILDFKRVSYTFTTTNETDRILLRFDNNGSLDGNTATLTCKEYCLSLGNNVTYVEPKSNKKEILLNEPLRGLPNGVKDTIEKVNGEWKIVRRCGEVVVDGTDYVAHDFPPSQNSTIAFAVKQGTHSNTDNAPILNDKFINVLGDKYWNEDKECLISADTNHFKFRITRNKLESEDEAGFKKWLSQNPTKIIYELTTPTIEDISPVTLQCWKNGTISIDEVLPVETTHTVALNKPAQIKRNIEELTVLRKRVQALEDFYDQVALEQSHQLSLLNHSIELDYDI